MYFSLYLLIFSKWKYPTGFLLTGPTFIFFGTISLAPFPLQAKWSFSLFLIGDLSSQTSQSSSGLSSYVILDENSVLICSASLFTTMEKQSEVLHLADNYFRKYAQNAEG